MPRGPQVASWFDRIAEQIGKMIRHWEKEKQDILQIPGKLHSSKQKHGNWQLTETFIH